MGFGEEELVEMHHTGRIGAVPTATDMVEKKELSCVLFSLSGVFSSGCLLRLVKRLPAECRFQLFFSYLSIHNLKRLPAACRFQLLFFLIVPNII